MGDVDRLALPVTSVSDMFSVPTEAPLSSMPTWPARVGGDD
jgi:hypothetical protein